MLLTSVSSEDTESHPRATGHRNEDPDPEGPELATAHHLPGGPLRHPVHLNPGADQQAHHKT